MHSKFITQSFILLSCFTISSQLYAEPRSDRLLCPDLETVRQYSNKIEVAYPDPDGSYNAYSDPIVDPYKKSAWMVTVNYIEAKSSDEALKLAQKMLLNINSQFSQYPYKLNMLGTKWDFCSYDNNISLMGLFYEGPIINHKISWHQKLFDIKN